MIKKVIAIDGPAASGKGTLARKLAETLNFAHLDTGAIYRMVALQLVQQNKEFSEDLAIEAAQFVQQNLTDELMHHPDLRLDDVGTMASKVSAVPLVRGILLDMQRNFAQNPPAGFNGAVLDGRDIGTIVCPNADLKLYVTASVEIRAKRRFDELERRGLKANYDDVLQDMKERDFRDTNRETAPLKPAEDAVILDTSQMTAEEAFQVALDMARS